MNSPFSRPSILSPRRARMFSTPILFSFSIASSTSLIVEFTQVRWASGSMPYLFLRRSAISAVREFLLPPALYVTET